MTEEIKTKGQLHIQLFENGVLVQEQTVPNTITTLGKEWLADQLGARLQPPIIAMAIGTGTPTTTALGTEISRRGFRSSSSSGAVQTFVTEWNLEDNVSGTIIEAGLFNSASATTATMICSSIFAGIVKVVNGTLVITWTVTIL